MIFSADNLPQVKNNSTSYVDLVGISMGVPRIEGESSEIYRNRLRDFSQLSRGPEYEGLLNEINLQLGLRPYAGIRIDDPTGAFELHSGLFGLKLSNENETLNISFLNFSPDDFWEWKTFTDIAKEINLSRSFVATVLADGFGFQFPKQSNLVFVSSEPIAGKSILLSRGNAVYETLVFSTPVPSHFLTPDGKTLHFDLSVSDNCRVSYQSKICPYETVAVPAGVLSLLDPDFGTASINPATGKMAYQVREYLQAVSAADGSYWSK